MLIPNPPEVVIENGSIKNSEQLKRYWQDFHHRDYLISRAWRNNCAALSFLNNQTEKQRPRLTDHLKFITQKPLEIKKPQNKQIGVDI